ncbi:sugar phosphate isomerase/epimerase family protein [Phyllobacterium sophorae]|uniref:Sugar phosphate isomerase/epimerase n=1 Tax=Phyllobacterium sophorae TaxID=1520277 RepID=A0A2P7B6T2_9HYPH|nr:TIM barrel protein [Phyllobacterium sophorae]PSH62130.1 sugar phosphate isomerase/epimerase [Phyllobacterium sophorae]
MHQHIDLRQVSVANLTIGRTDPVRFVETAASAGFGAVGLLLMTATPQPLEFEILGRPEVVLDLKAALKSNAMRVFDVEAFVLSPSADLARFRRALETGAELGATHISAIGTQLSKEGVFLTKSEREDLFGRLCDQAADYGLHVGVEYMLYRDVATWRDALDLVESAGRPNAGLIVDVLHHYRGAGTADDLASIPSSRIAYAQLSDATKVSPGIGDLPAEARGDRLALGDGAIPLSDYLDALPDDTQLVIETPIANQLAWPLSDRMQSAADRSREFFEKRASAFAKLS